MSCDAFKIIDAIDKEVSLNDEKFKDQYLSKNKDWWRTYVLNSKNSMWWAFNFLKKQHRPTCNVCKVSLNVCTMRPLLGNNYCPDCLEKEYDKEKDEFQNTDFNAKLGEWMIKVIAIKVTKKDIEEYNNFKPLTKFDFLDV